MIDIPPEGRRLTDDEYRSLYRECADDPAWCRKIAADLLGGADDPAMNQMAERARNCALEAAGVS